MSVREAIINDESDIPFSEDLTFQDICTYQLIEKNLLSQNCFMNILIIIILTCMIIVII